MPLELPEEVSLEDSGLVLSIEGRVQNHESG